MTENSASLIPPVIPPSKVNSKGGVAPFLIFSITLICLYFGSQIILPFLFSLFLFLLLDPLVSFMEQHRMPSRVAASLAVLLAIVFMSATAFAFYNSLMRVTDRLPAYSEKFSAITERLHGKARDLQKNTEFIFSPSLQKRSAVNLSGKEDDIQKVQVVENRASSLLSPYVLRGVNSFLSIMSLFFFIPLISFFMLLERDFLRTRLAELFHDRALYETSCAEIRAVSRSFFLGNTIVGSSMTLVFACIFKSLHLEDGLELALFAGFLNLIPVFGDRKSVV